MAAGTVRVGTSGWQYDHWRSAFYPDELPRRRWLEYYQSMFPAVEVNSTFYRLPSSQTVDSWHDAAPPNFRYAAKGSRFVTHRKDIAGRPEAIDRLYGLLSRLKSHLGVILWQFPEFLERDDDALAAFLRALPAGTRHALEFRHESWFCGPVYQRLGEHGAALVAVSSSQFGPVRLAPAGFVYARFHGLAKGFAHNYSDTELAPWAEWAQEMARNGRDGYFFFNNDGEARAPQNAARFIEMIGDAAMAWGDEVRSPRRPVPTSRSRRHRPAPATAVGARS